MLQTYLRVHCVERWDVFTQVHPFDRCSLDVVTDLSGFWASGGRSSCELQLERQKHRERVTVTLFPNMSSFIALPSCYVCTNSRVRGNQVFSQRTLPSFFCRFEAVMTWNQEGAVITGGSPYCQGDFYSRLWFPLWYYWGSELPVLISTGDTQLWRCNMTGMRICVMCLQVPVISVCIFSCCAWHIVLQFNVYKSYTM